VRSCLYLLIFLCVVGIYTAFTWAMGDLYGYKVRYATSQWQERSELPSLAEVVQAMEDADAALGWETDNPEYKELKARVLYYRALINGPDSAGVADIREAALLHRDAIELRPRWPYSWANLVLMKAHLGEVDDEYQYALEQAIRFGPWEQSVHISLTHAAVLSWSSLSKEQKSLYAGNIERGLVRDFRAMRTTLDAYQKRSVVCAYLKRSPKQKRLCVAK